MKTVSKIRVGFNARFLSDQNLRGFNRYTFCLLKELQRHEQLELVLFTDRRSPVHPFFREMIRAQVVTVDSPRVLLWEHVILPLALRRHRIDLFHAPADGGLPRWRVCPYVLTYHRAVDKSLQHWVSSGVLEGILADYHTMPNGLKGRYLAWRHALLRQIYLRSADKVITVSQFGKWEMVELLGVPEEKVEVIHLAADEAFASDIPAERIEAARYRFCLAPRYFLFVGSFDPWKNVQGLIKAYAEAKKGGVQEGLVLVGIGGDLPGAQAFSRSLCLEEGRDVVFLERIDKDLPALYHGATAFVTLSWGESFCLPVVEAMSCGIPVIASNFGAIPEILADGGLLVDPRNLGEVVHAMQAVTAQEGLRAELKVKAIRRARAFSWRKTAEQTVKVYEEVVGRWTGSTKARR